MSTTDKPAAGNGQTSAVPAAPAADATQAQPTMRILGQYLKDLSFENPNAPQSLAPQQTQPDINIAVNVNARNLAPTDFEVELHLDAKATQQDKVVFAAELLYAGTFRLENFPANVLHAAVLIECPRMLFPFARQILADATRNGGFPPLMLDPIDFTGMYQKRMQAQMEASATAKA
ncbi:MAG: protein-export chaperone SecB [Rhizobiales bacterium]|nr:protein-export chaperone SecB [Hyphomicrobiales bacterium]MBI3674629.1 protein-export chaperone SecB [Hyphomicrobiales bacterium]